MVPVLVMDKNNKVEPHLEFIGIVRRAKVYKKKCRANGCTKEINVQSLPGQMELDLKFKH